jgi:hypothetical protein
MNPSATYAQPKRPQTNKHAAERAHPSARRFPPLRALSARAKSTLGKGRVGPDRIAGTRTSAGAADRQPQPGDPHPTDFQPPAPNVSPAPRCAPRGHLAPQRATASRTPRLLPVLQYPRVALELRGYARAYLGGVGIAVEVLERDSEHDHHLRHHDPSIDGPSTGPAEVRSRRGRAGWITNEPPRHTPYARPTRTRGYRPAPWAKAGALPNCHICTGTKWARPGLPHLHRDWARPCLPHLHRDLAHPGHICARTGLAPATSAPGPGSPLPHLRRDWGSPASTAGTS